MEPDPVITPSEKNAAPFDMAHKTVRILQRHANGFVEFSFAVGDPDVCVELVMPEAAFAEFCAQHSVALLASETPAPWGLRDARAHRL